MEKQLSPDALNALCGIKEYMYAVEKFKRTVSQTLHTAIHEGCPGLPTHVHGIPSPHVCTITLFQSYYPTIVLGIL